MWNNIILKHYYAKSGLEMCVFLGHNVNVTIINDLKYLNWVGMRGRFLGPEIGGRRLVPPLPHGQSATDYYYYYVMRGVQAYTWCI